jgi:ADP-sugar diphosphatase
MLQELDRQEIEDLKDKLTGEKSQGEMITLRVCDYEQLWQHGARDAKTLAAWALYEGLNRQGLIEAERLKTNTNLPSKNVEEE